MSTQPVKVPSIGESISEVIIASWRKAEGEAVAADEPLVEVESDKATVEIPAPVGGVLEKIVIPEGEPANVGDIIAQINAGATAAAPTKGNGASDVESAPAEAPPAAESAAPVKASPSTRKLMAQSGVQAGDVQATGPAGRIERADVMRAMQAEPPVQSISEVPTAPRVIEGPQPPAAAPARRAGVGGPRERSGQQRVVRMTPLRRTVARRLLEAQRNAAILTTFNEINMEGVMALRAKYKQAFVDRHGVKLGFMSFFVKAAVEALKAFPVVNAEVVGEDIVYKDYYDIGVAVGGGRGLVVPVVRDCDRLSLAEIEKSIGELAKRAKENRLAIEELQGGTFTISNGGVYGSMMSTPILNPPQSGILGLHKIDKRAVVIDDAIVARPMMYIALSYDHRIVDGREAVQFLVRIKECIEDPERLLIEV